MNMYPETKCLNCEEIIPARTRRKRWCDNLCRSNYIHKLGVQKDKNYWKKLYQYAKRQKEKRMVGIKKEMPEFSRSWVSAERWAAMYFKLGHNEMRKLAGLKPEEIKQAETVAELFALRKG